MIKTLLKYLILNILNVILKIMNKLILLLFLSIQLANAQSDNDIMILLDSVSNKTDSYDGIKIKFDYNLINSDENIFESSIGDIIIKDDQYIFNFLEIQQISDGENVWTILIDDKEVQISEIEFDDENAMTPSNLLKLYEKGFIFKLVNKTNEYTTIDLIPENIDEVDYSKIELIINTKKYQINKLSQFGNNSSIIEYKIKEFNEINLPDSVFKFNIDAYKDFEIIDLR